MIIEHAAGMTSGSVVTRQHVISRAPKWWRDLAAGGKPAAKRAASPLPASVANRAPLGVIGWIYGLACCGVSLPCRSATDSQELPEQFHTDALQSLVEQANKSRSIFLRLGHEGPAVASNGGTDLILQMATVAGMPAVAMEARVRATQAGTKAMRGFDVGLMGVSICFRSPKHYHAERPGYGLVRVITSAQLDHIALVPKGTAMRAAYPACMASGSTTCTVGPSPAMRHVVMHRAFDELASQARRMG
jgi:hypothetical protein